MDETVRQGMELAATALDTLAVAVILGGAIIAAVRGNIVSVLLHLDDAAAVSRYKKQLVNGLLIGLDLLVASDVIKTAALSATLYNVGTLGALVVVRIVLTWSLVVEAEGRWPWQARGSEGDGADRK